VKRSTILLLGTLGLTVTFLFSCSESKPAEAVKVTQVMNWFAEPELGGQYAALAKGYYKDAGIDMTNQSGGPGVSSVQIVAAGKAQFGVTEADGILLARKEGVPVVAIAAIFQKNPQVFIYHKEDTSLKDFSSFNGHQVIVGAGAPFWEYIKKAYKLDKVKEVAYTGQLGPFIADKTAVIQGYLTSEPFALAAQGVDSGAFLIHDSGYQPYTTVLFTTEKLIKEQPDLVAKYVSATIKGWEYYKVNFEEINASTIQKENPDLKLDAMKLGATAEMDLIFGMDAATGGVGTMTKDRWDALGGQLKGLNLIPADLDISAAYTTQFLPKK
jgi:NitT/TauT family transport system substrate-binding protein